MKEVIIEAVESNDDCKGCNWEWCTDHCETVIQRQVSNGLPDCNLGYIYKIKEK